MLNWTLNPSLASLQCERAWVEVDLEALADNVQQLKRLLSPTTELMAIIKADAYGHGAVTVAQTALHYGATWLGVATLSEGVELREAGIQAPILLLGATNTPAQVRAIARWQLQPTLCTPQQALMFSKALETIGQSLPVHLNLDTGMSRLGTPWQQAVELVQLINCLPRLQLASIYSHLATADSPNSSTMYLQQARYQEVITQLQKLKIALPKLHLANSAATLSDPAMHYDLVRVGLAIYGLYPASHLQGKVNLKPVLQVKARVTQVKTIQPGTGVSYGHQYIANRETRLAVVGIGYADGVPRSLSNRMMVLVRGQRIPQIGAITMDQLMLDVSKIPDLREGEVVTLIGQDGAEQISVDNWATMLDTIAWEVLCGFKHRLPRVPVSNPLRLRTSHNLTSV
ncbi:alanine racemase [Leptolyngbya sp. NK1-12]|uniref:Alanine racemase n=1 Tax=Leptolyngbya sp. NK1-12 TaxID=2547451 RepID=A0AA96WKN3_9CYAN|nr:alanine racemase [Leptolyngbya sp. NK1-12]WNZ27163.1 alanine racemase [Leptolyngbya sp. NK1-12]